MRSCAGKATVAKRRAVISVADKTGLAELARGLVACGFELLASGGTAAAMRAAGVEASAIEDVAGRGAMLSGRIKTMHPAITGGVLADRDQPGHLRELEEIGAGPIDLVVVNFYPFASAVAEGKEGAELIELIDIGGPTLVRAAAKNHRHVAVVVDPADYESLLEMMEEGGPSPEQRERLAAKAFACTHAYESGISSYFNSQPLRYGENPHQQAAVEGLEKVFRQASGAPLSYNNINDAMLAWRCALDFDSVPAAAIIKHATPCGVAAADDIVSAMERARLADPTSAYGGVLAVNRPLDVPAIKTFMKGKFFEVLIMPAADLDAGGLGGKLRVLLGQPLDGTARDTVTRHGVTLAQERDARVLQREEVQVAGKVEPTAAQWEELLFAWRVAKHAQSNAIVLSKERQSIGIGAGQTSRVCSAELAVKLARDNGHDPAGACAASDGFFPFADGLEKLAAAGVAAVIQPGGSKRDTEVIAAADAADVALVHAGVRHFRH